MLQIECYLAVTGVTFAKSEKCLPSGQYAPSSSSSSSSSESSKTRAGSRGRFASFPTSGKGAEKKIQ